MNQSFDVLVIGGGVVGLAAAIAMSQRHLSVALIDAGTLSVETSTIDARVYAINHASQALFESLGVWEQLDTTRLSPYTHMHVWDAANLAHIDFDARMISTDRLGTIIEESIIKQALLQELSTQRITTFPDCKVTDICFSPDAIYISAGTKQWQAKLLIIADGASSASRQLLGVSVTNWPYHQHALVTTVKTEKPHLDTAYQVFNADGPLAFLPLSHPSQCSIVWSTSPKRAQTLMNLADEAFADQLTEAFATKLGQCTLIGKRHQFPLHMRHAQRYAGPRWLLMGDAAHTIHPLAGLGLNIGLADLASWIAILDANDAYPVWTKRILGAYHRRRKYTVWQSILLMESLKAFFANPLPSIATARGLGIRACDSLLPLKRLFIGHVDT